MKKILSLEFSEMHQKVAIELDDSQSPNTVKSIIENLPIKVMINRWGDELYTDEMPIRVEEEHARSTVNLLDVAYWPEGSALCLFYGPTPVSKGDKIIPYSPVNIIGRVIAEQADAHEFLKSVEKKYLNKKVPAMLS
jgi:hypothetical protein